MTPPPETPGAASSWTRLKDLPRRTKRAWLAGIVVAVLAGVAVVTIVDYRNGPEDVVRKYFAAVTGGDVESALALVAPYSLPTGEAARLLDADAIRHDWKVTAIGDAKHESPSGTWSVPVSMGGPAGSAKGSILVRHDDINGWALHNPFAYVTFARSPLEYMQVNEFAPTTMGPSAQDGTAYALFPGVYTFFASSPDAVRVSGRGPLAAMPDAASDSAESRPFHVGKVTAKKAARESARKGLNAVIDDCVASTRALPQNCPFGVGDFVNTSDGEHVTELRDFRWKVHKYPGSVELGDTRYLADAGDDSTGFRFTDAKSGSVTLSGSGVDTNGDDTDFTVDCRIDPSAFTATVDAEGKATVTYFEPLKSSSSEDGTCAKES